MTVVLTVRIGRIGVNPMETEEYGLDRRASALKKAGDWSGAIAALHERKALMGVGWTDDKLAKYLQHAGRFDEAMAEIQWLLDNSQRYVEQLLGHRPASVQQSSRAVHCMQVHRAAALICKREGRADLQAHHEHLAERYGAIRARLEPIAREAMKGSSGGSSGQRFPIDNEGVRDEKAVFEMRLGE